MTHRNNLGAHTIAILTALEDRGTSTARQVTDATGLEYDTARQYLRRCAFRGLVTVDHVGRVPAYTVKPTWRERLEPKKPPAKPKPETTVAKAIASAPALHTIWMNRKEPMLMRVTETVDYNHIKPEHEAIHALLVNWERWVRVRPHGWQTHPMWRSALTSKQWEASPHISTPVNTLDAVLMEKAVYALPEKHREAVRWWYVYRRDPVAMARNLGVSKQGLADLVEAGRTMLQNRIGKS